MIKRAPGNVRYLGKFGENILTRSFTARDPKPTLRGREDRVSVRVRRSDCVVLAHQKRRLPRQSPHHAPRDLQRRQAALSIRARHQNTAGRTITLRVFGSYLPRPDSGILPEGRLGSLLVTGNEPAIEVEVTTVGLNCTTTCSDWPGPIVAIPPPPSRL